MPMRMKSRFAQPFRPISLRRSVLRVLALCAGALFVAGCGLLSGTEATATPTRAMAAVVPTFTSTPEGAMAAQGSGGGATTQQAAPAAAAATGTGGDRYAGADGYACADGGALYGQDGPDGGERQRAHRAEHGVRHHRHGGEGGAVRYQRQEPGVHVVSVLLRGRTDGLDFLQSGQCGECASDHAGAECSGDAGPANGYAGPAHSGSRASTCRPLRGYRRRWLQVLAAECRSCRQWWRGIEASDRLLCMGGAATRSR